MMEKELRKRQYIELLVALDAYQLRLSTSSCLRNIEKVIYSCFNKNSSIYLCTYIWRGLLRSYSWWRRRGKAFAMKKVNIKMKALQSLSAFL